MKRWELHWVYIRVAFTGTTGTPETLLFIEKRD